MVALVLALLTQTPSPADDLRQKLDALGPRHFSGLLAIYRDGKEKFFHSVGHMNPESKRKFTRDTVIELGSIVKSFVKMAFFRLAEEGKLSPEDPISKYFAKVPEDKRGITIQMLLDHTAGFQDVFGGDYEPMKRDDLMRKMLESKLLFKPGERDEYSNSGYSMLSTILEKITGKPIDDFLYESQFVPLKMPRTGYLRPKWKKADLPIGIDRQGKRWGTPMDRFWYPDGPSWNLRGNGGMMSTTAEMAKWAHGMFETDFVSNGIRMQFSPTMFAPDAPKTKVWLGAGGNGIFNTVIAYSHGYRLTVIAFSTDGRLEIENELRGLLPLTLKVGTTD